MPPVRRQSVRTFVTAPLPSQVADQATEEPTVLSVQPVSSPVVPVVPEGKPLGPKRSKIGWQIRDDLIKACKQLALDTNVHDYEVLEMLLEEALARRKEEI